MMPSISTRCALEYSLLISFSAFPFVVVQVLSHGCEIDNMGVSNVGERLTSWRCQHQIGELSLFKKAGIKKNAACEEK
jgi:hypothetical protein